MTKALQTTNTTTDKAEAALMTGDLSTLSFAERLNYYQRICASLGLNPLTKPFEYIKLNGKLTLYARKDCTDQLRNLKGVSIAKPDIQQIDNMIIVTVSAQDSTGRTDSDIGVVMNSDMGGNIANALMKAVTKAKRRVTLSICGLGMLDETEIETIPNAQPFVEPKPQLAPSGVDAEIADLCKQLNANGDSIEWTKAELVEFAAVHLGYDEPVAWSEMPESDKRELVNELTERLNERLTIVGADAQPEGK